MNIRPTLLCALLAVTLATATGGCVDEPASGIQSGGIPDHPAFTYTDPTGRNVEVHLYVVSDVADSFRVVTNSLGAFGMKSDQTTGALLHLPADTWHIGTLAKGSNTLKITGWKNGAPISHQTTEFLLGRDTAIIMRPY